MYWMHSIILYMNIIYILHYILIKRYYMSISMNKEHCTWIKILINSCWPLGYTGYIFLVNPRNITEKRFMPGQRALFSRKPHDRHPSTASSPRALWISLDQGSAKFSLVILLPDPKTIFGACAMDFTHVLLRLEGLGRISMWYKLIYNIGFDP
jgi:hypothetical protein